MADKWLICCDISGFSSPASGTVVLVEGTGFSELDGKSFAIHAITDAAFYLLDLAYAGDSSGSYPDSAYIENVYGATVSGGTIRRMIVSVSGLDHLEGLYVEGLGDGKVIAPLLITGGEVTLPEPYAVVVLGLAYTTYVEPTGVAMNSETGSKLDQTARIHSVGVRFKDTLGATVATCNGSKTDNLDLAWSSIRWREDTDTADEADLFTGLVNVSLNSGFSVEPRVVLRQDKPFPMNVLSVTYNYKITGGK